MSNEVARAHDGWGAVPDDASGSLRGSYIKFADGEFSIGKNAEPFPGDRSVVVTGVVTLFQKWEDGKPVEQRITRPGQRHPERDELPDLDESEWELGLNGEPADPWKDSRLLYPIDPATDEEFTFVTSSMGGRRAVGDLKGQISNMRCAHPGAVPIVQLNSEKMKTRFGMKPKPLFKVVGWRQSAAETAGPVKQIDPPDGFEERHEVSDDMSDEIPF
jgi:hypothetical protein